MSNAPSISQMDPRTDAFNFDRITSAGTYVYLPMLIMATLSGIAFVMKIASNDKSIPTYIFLPLLGFFLGNLGYHNISSWMNLDQPGVGKRIKCLVYGVISELLLV